jgi:hypothetical protein
MGDTGVFDRSLRVDAVLVVKVDVVGAEPPEGTLERGADVCGAAVETPRAAAGVGDETELRRENDVVATILDRACDEFLVGEGAVDLRGVDERDAEVEPTMDRADGFFIVGARAGVGGRHAHSAETDAADIKRSQVDVLHRCAPFSGGVRLGHYGASSPYS